MLNNPRTLIVLYLMLAPLTALSQEQKIFNPKGWEIEQQIMKDRQVKLLEHIKNPVGLQLAKPDPDIADWEIDWKAQQQFCRAVADVIFKTPEKIEFAKPDFSFSRDDTSLYIEMNKKAYPKCKSYEYSKTEENIYKKRQLEG